jgi:hypothetical protein
MHLYMYFDLFTCILWLCYVLLICNYILAYEYMFNHSLIIIQVRSLHQLIQIVGCCFLSLGLLFIMANKVNDHSCFSLFVCVIVLWCLHKKTRCRGCKTVTHSVKVTWWTNINLTLPIRPFVSRLSLVILCGPTQYTPSSPPWPSYSYW